MGLIFAITTSAAVTLLAVAVGLILKGLNQLRLKDQIEENQITRVADLIPGVVEVFGNALDLPLVKSPVQATDCLAFHYIVERLVLRKSSTNPAITGGVTAQQLLDKKLRHRGEPNVNHWVVVAEGTSKVPFVIDDGSGQVIVDPDGCRMNFKRQFEYESDAPDGKKFLPAPMLDFVEQKGIEMNALIRFREWVIRPNERVFVMGTARESERDDRARKTAAEERAKMARFRIGRSDDVELVISDIDKKELRGILARSGWSKVVAGLAISCIPVAYFLWLMSRFLALN